MSDFRWCRVRWISSVISHLEGVVSKPLPIPVGSARRTTYLQVLGVGGGGGGQVTSSLELRHRGLGGRCLCSSLLSARCAWGVGGGGEDVVVAAPNGRCLCAKVVGSGTMITLWGSASFRHGLGGNLWPVWLPYNNSSKSVKNLYFKIRLRDPLKRGIAHDTVE